VYYTESHRGYRCLREGRDSERSLTFYCAGKKATLATGRKFWQEQFVWKGRTGRGHRFCLASTSGNTPTRTRLPSPPPAAAHIRNTNRHTWSRWLSKNKGFYQFVCHPPTIYLCNISSHSSALSLKQFPFALRTPSTFTVGTHSSACPSNGDTTTRGEQLPADESEQDIRIEGNLNPPDCLLEFYSEKESQTAQCLQFQHMVLKMQSYMHDIASSSLLNKHSSIASSDYGTHHAMRATFSWRYLNTHTGS